MNLSGKNARSFLFACWTTQRSNHPKQHWKRVPIHLHAVTLPMDQSRITGYALSNWRRDEETDLERPIQRWLDTVCDTERILRAGS